ncbi:MltA domain-containing protein [Paucibacter sp. O1-1]|nr:MltA domain-containing protein [Paucibacter sp. O1-1]MDA3829027.1 MltA domain-containing protein [Paucibacter sp. O1-1]
MSLSTLSWRAGLAAAILGALAACSTTPLPPMPPGPAPAPSTTTPAAPPERERATLLRERSRWLASDWSELPGWGEDRAAELWPALLRGCARPAPGWAGLCARAARDRPADDVEAHLWLMKHLQPYRVESLDGQTQGLATGYYEPLLEATRRPQGSFRVPLHAAPPDLQQRRPYFSRQQIATEQRERLRAQELLYIEDPLDALVLQIQGSGRVRVQESDGRQRLARLAFAGHNDLPYQSLGKLLIERGELRAEQASWPAIKDWARRNPARLNELLWQNPRYVFFREEPLPDPELGPRGAQGVPLTPGRSIAVDRASIPYGTPVWLDSSEPLSDTPLRRLVMAQDTGSAIVGAVRADYFWGWGSEAEVQAGRMKQALRLWALWPRDPS